MSTQKTITYILNTVSGCCLDGFLYGTSKYLEMDGFWDVKPFRLVDIY